MNLFLLSDITLLFFLLLRCNLPGIARGSPSVSLIEDAI